MTHEILVKVICVSSVCRGQSIQLYDKHFLTFYLNILTVLFETPKSVLERY